MFKKFDWLSLAIGTHLNKTTTNRESDSKLLIFEILENSFITLGASVRHGTWYEKAKTVLNVQLSN